MPSSLGLVWTGCLAIIASWFLTGCRFGNRLEYAEPKTLTGYYETTATSLNFCVQSQGSAATLCRVAPTNQVPSLVASVFSNPVAFQMINENTGTGMVIGLPDRIAVDVLVRPNTNSFTIAFEIPDPIIPYVAEGCAVTMDWDGAGIAAKGTRHQLGSYEIKGRVELALSVTTTIVGNCQPLRNRLQSCYLNETQCNGETTSQNRALYDRVHRALDPFVTAGALTPAQIPSIESAGFQITYQ